MVECLCLTLARSTRKKYLNVKSEKIVTVIDVEKNRPVRSRIYDAKLKS